MVQYKMPKNGDDGLSIYIKASAELWYCFGYQSDEKGGLLNITSSSTRFNDLLGSMKAKETQIKMSNGKTLEIILVDPSSANNFVNKMKNGRLKE